MCVCTLPVRLLFWGFFGTSTFITAVRLLILAVFCQPVRLLATGTLISLGASVFSCPVLMEDGPAYLTSLCTVARPISAAACDGKKVRLWQVRKGRLSI